MDNSILVSAPRLQRLQRIRRCGSQSIIENMNTADLAKIFDSKRWKKLGHWKKSLMLDWIEVSSLGIENFKRAGLDWHIDNYGFVAHTAMIGEDDFQATKAYFERMLTSNISFAAEHGARCYASGNRLLEFSASLTRHKDWKQISTAELIDRFNKFVSLVADNIPFFPPLIPLEEVLGERIRLLLSDHLKRKDIGQIHLFDYLSIFSAPKRTPAMIGKREALLRLGQRIQSEPDVNRLFLANDAATVETRVQTTKPDIWRAIRNYVKDYGWLGTFGWIGNPISESDAVAELKEILGTDCTDQLNNLQLDHEASDHSIEAALIDLEASVELRRLIEVIREYAYLRLFRIDIYNKAFFDASDLFSTMAGRIDGTVEQLLLLTPTEVEQCLKSQRTLDRRLVEDRTRGFTILRMDGRVSLLAGADFDEFEQSRHKEDYSHLTTVQGDPIFKGKVHGPAKVVMDSSELSKVNRGDVLVAPMTNPDFTSVFGKIAGIVTDEGGVLCHAAIVAREYKLPCVIGTKIATKVFRDNDPLHLDATSGRVTKIDQPPVILRSGKGREPARISISVAGHDIDVRDKLITWLDDKSSRLAEVGSKFHNLVILHKQGFRIPHAFCVTTGAFRYFLHFNNLTDRINQTLDGLNFDNGEEVTTRARRIRAFIGSGRMPPIVAEAIGKGLTRLASTAVSVRSSSTSEDLAEASFAGVYDSFLNVIGIKQVLQNIKACWASLFSERSLYYYFEQVKKERLSTSDIALAVIVQDLIHSQKSGISFTANPESLRNDEIVIEAAYGLGEGVVSGEVASDTYIVRKGTWQVISRKLSEKLAAVVPDKAGGVREMRMEEEANDLPVLSDQEVRELAEVSSKIESVFGSPQDIEWSKDQVRGFFILQSRPITTFYQ